ncbi:hypothetical protein LINPERHAP2_LOCUS37763, partial [Linum perenne]
MRYRSCHISIFPSFKPSPSFSLLYSRSEGCVFDSRRVQHQHFSSFKHYFLFSLLLLQIRRFGVRFTSGSIPITTIYFLWRICNSDVTQVLFLVALIHELKKK